MNLSDQQAALVLDMFWNLLEFDPDEKEAEPATLEDTIKTIKSGGNNPSPQNNSKEQIQFVGDDLVNKEDREFGALLKHKFDLLKELVVKATQRTDVSCLTVVHARKLASYAHQTYFRHLRLYDFVLKNTKSSENKHINIPLSAPNCGRDLEDAIVLEDKVTQIMYEPDEENLVENSITKNSSQNIGKLDRKMNTQSSIKEQKSQLEESERSQLRSDALNSATDSDMGEDLRATSKIDGKTKNVIHRTTKTWNERIAE